MYDCNHNHILSEVITDDRRLTVVTVNENLTEVNLLVLQVKVSLGIIRILDTRCNCKKEVQPPLVYLPSGDA